MKSLPRAASAAAFLALAAVAGPAQAGIVGVPATLYFAKNTTGVQLTCRIRKDGAEWSKEFGVAGAGEISLSTNVYEPLELSCRQPVETGVFALKPGERYAFLRGPSGGVILRHVDIPR